MIILRISFTVLWYAICTLVCHLDVILLVGILDVNWFATALFDLSNANLFLIWFRNLVSSKLLNDYKCNFLHQVSVVLKCSVQDKQGVLMPL